MNFFDFTAIQQHSLHLAHTSIGLDTDRDAALFDDITFIASLACANTSFVPCRYASRLAFSRLYSRYRSLYISPAGRRVTIERLGSFHAIVAVDKHSAKEYIYYYFISILRRLASYDTPAADRGDYWLPLSSLYNAFTTLALDIYICIIEIIAALLAIAAALHIYVIFFLILEDFRYWCIDAYDTYCRHFTTRLSSS